MTDYQKFLEAFKMLEASIKDKTSTSLLDYENSLNRSPEGERLQVCRIIRNYAAHHEDGAKFLNYPEMTKFLTTENQKFLSIHTTVGNVVGKQEPLTEKTSLKDAFSLLAKAKENYLPIIDSKTKEVLGICTADMLVSACSKASRITEKVLGYITKADIRRSRTAAEFANSPNDNLSYFTPGSPVILLNKDGQYQKIVFWTKLK